jgi:hypothetical protein
MRGRVHLKFPTKLSCSWGPPQITGLFFSLAISAIVTFVIINIDSEENKMSNDSESTQTTTVNIRESTNESANIPTMQKVPSGTEVGQNSANIPTMQQAPGTQTTSQSSGNSSGGESGKSE